MMSASEPLLGNLTDPPSVTIRARKMPRLCGEKLSSCCFVLSIWGVLMLVILVIFCGYLCYAKKEPQYFTFKFAALCCNYTGGSPLSNSANLWLFKYNDREWFCINRNMMVPVLEDQRLTFGNGYGFRACTFDSTALQIGPGVLMGVFFHIKAVALIEDIPSIHGDPDWDKGYQQASHNCFVAAGLYFLTFLFSGYQMYAINRGYSRL